MEFGKKLNTWITRHEEFKLQKIELKILKLEPQSLEMK